MPPPTTRWTIDSCTHAFPDTTFNDAEEKVYGALTGEVVHAPQTVPFTAKEVRAHFDAKIKAVSIAEGMTQLYRWDYHVMVLELERIAGGELKRHLAENSTWSNGDKVSSYYNQIFVMLFPTIADSFKEKNSHVVISTASLEQSFSEANDHCHFNSSANRNANQLQHANGVKGAINRMLPNEAKRHPTKHSDPAKPNQRNRKCRSSASRCNYAEHLWQKIREVDAFGIKKSRENVRHVQEKLEADRVKTQAYVVAELASSKRGGSSMFTEEKLVEHVTAFDSTCCTGEIKFF